MHFKSFLQATGIRLAVALPILLMIGCAAGTDSLTARLAAANLVAASAAQGLATAARTQAIKPDSTTAAAILQTLDAVESSLDGAGLALRAGLPEMASHNLDAAEAQLSVLQPMLPAVATAGQ